MPKLVCGFFDWGEKMIVNGNQTEYKDITVNELLEIYDLSDTPLAVECDGVILSKEDYDTVLKEGQKVEIITFVGGG